MTASETARQEKWSPPSAPGSPGAGGTELGLSAPDRTAGLGRTPGPRPFLCEPISERGAGVMGSAGDEEDGSWGEAAGVVEVGGVVGVGECVGGRLKRRRAAADLRRDSSRGAERMRSRRVWTATGRVRAARAAARRLETSVRASRVERALSERAQSSSAVMVRLWRRAISLRVSSGLRKSRRSGLFSGEEGSDDGMAAVFTDRGLGGDGGRSRAKSGRDGRLRTRPVGRARKRARGREVGQRAKGQMANDADHGRCCACGE